MKATESNTLSRLTNQEHPTDNIFNACKLQIDGISFVLSGEVPDLLTKGAILIDLREELETMIKAFGIKNIIYLPYSQFEQNWQSLPFEQPLLFADSVGLHSKEAVKILKSKGYQNLASLAGGFAGWQQDGQPVKAGKYHPLNGPCPCLIKSHERK